MKYYFTKKIASKNFEEAIEQIRKELQKEGFGVLTEIDIKSTLKKKIDVDFKKYQILGACHPQSAYKALKSEDKIGLFLPCNVIVQEHEDGTIEISAVDPVASMMAVKNESLGEVATEIQQKLNTVINRLI